MQSVIVNYQELMVYVFSCIPYSGYFSWGKIFVNSEFLPSSWKNFRGRSI